MILCVCCSGVRSSVFCSELIALCDVFFFFFNLFPLLVVVICPCFILTWTAVLCRECWKHLGDITDILFICTLARVNSSCTRFASDKKDDTWMENPCSIFLPSSLLKQDLCSACCIFWALFSVWHVSPLSLQCQGVGGIIVVTIVTSFMLVYNSSGDRSSSVSRHTAEPVPTQKQPQRASTLEGYLRVVDHKVNEHLLILLLYAKYQLNLLPPLGELRCRNINELLGKIRKYLS